jgi:Fe-S-cluster containining protein
MNESRETAPVDNTNFDAHENGRHRYSAPNLRRMTPAATDSWVDQLCTRCGLCCNGMLFRDVRLQKTDPIRLLRRLGLTIETKGARSCLLQPCTGLQGSLCRIYDNRPSRCRSFECHVLQRAIAGSLDVRTARRHIRRALTLAERIEEDLAALGNPDTSKPLLERYAAVMALPIDLEDGPEISRRRGKLLTRVDTFMRFLQAEFLSPDPSTGP